MGLPLFRSKQELDLRVGVLQGISISRPCFMFNLIYGLPEDVQMQRLSTWIEDYPNPPILWVNASICSSPCPGPPKSDPETASSCGSRMPRPIRTEHISHGVE